jgi:hypothetical protein
MTDQDKHGHVFSKDDISRPCENCGRSRAEAAGRVCNSLGLSGDYERRTPIEAMADQIREWWIKQGEADSAEIRRKAIQYGAADLKIMGQAMQQLYPGKNELDAQSLQALGLEMACAFYALGKSARLFGAFEQGRAPTDDDWYDLHVYAGMARYIREHGRWM